MILTKNKNSHTIPITFDFYEKIVRKKNPIIITEFIKTLKKSNGIEKFADYEPFAKTIQSKSPIQIKTYKEVLDGAISFAKQIPATDIAETTIDNTTIRVSFVDST